MRLTACQQKLYERLADGKLHSVEDLALVLDPQIPAVQSVRHHVLGLRTALEKHGGGLQVCHEKYGRNRQSGYRLRRLLDDEE